MTWLTSATHKHAHKHTMINGSLLVSIIIVKWFSVKNFLSPAKTGPQNGGFSRKWGSNHSILVSRPPKGTSLRGTASFDVFCVKINLGASAVGERMNQKNNNNSRTRRVIFHAYVEKKPWFDLVKILHWGRCHGRNHLCKIWLRSVKEF